MALMNVKAVSPPVRARTPTPIGMATAMATFARGKPVQHALEEEPLAHEAAERRQGRDGQPTHQEDWSGDRHAPQEATEPVEVRDPVAWWIELAERNSDPLNTAWKTTWSSAATSATRARARCPVRRTGPKRRRRAAPGPCCR